MVRHDILDGKGGIRRHAGLKWSTHWSNNVTNFYPLYDWRVEDVWAYLGKRKLPYNKLYDWMHLHGTTLHEMRICQPYGDDQRVGLGQFHALEPDTWFRILRRVQGVNSGALYANQRIMGYRGALGLPPGQTWKRYTKLLLGSLPPDVRSQYIRNFVTFMLWWKEHRRSRGYPGMFDAGIKNPDTGKNIPSWQRMALCILRNDYLCHSLKFGQTVRMYERQQALKEKYRQL
jgi:predicted phosphoadenosine phosphosulfate sulfurtransferase